MVRILRRVVLDCLLNTFLDNTSLSLTDQTVFWTGIQFKIRFLFATFGHMGVVKPKDA